MTYEDIRKNEEVLALLKRGNANLRVLGYTDHSEVHTSLVAERAAMILQEFGYSKHEQELAKIAGFMHDIGNSINRKNHAEYGGILAYEILKNTDLPIEDRMVIMSSISNHDESTGCAINPVSAALIIADKTDIRRSRVLSDANSFDIYDRVNYAVVSASLDVCVEEKLITLNIEHDEKVCTMFEFLDVFLKRMMMAHDAADMLGAKFELKANGMKIL